MEERETKAIFIGGAGHSGTSMLFRIFSKHHRSLSIGSESRVAESLELLEKKYQKINSLDEKLSFLEQTSFYGVNFKKDKYKYVNKRTNLLEGSLSTQNLCGIFHKDYNKLILASLKKNDLDFIVEKTPSNVFHSKEISKLCENYKLIIIHRDVRDVVASLKKRYFTLLESPEVFSHNLEIKKLDKDYNLVIDSIMWNKLVMRSFKDASTSAKTNIRIIKYEKFVENPAKITASLCDWLGLDFNDQMLELKKRNSADPKNKNKIGISSSSVKSFIDILNAEELSVIEKYAHQGMKKLNLEPHNQNVNSIRKFRYEVQSYFKVLTRIRKRLALMESSYAINFSKRFINKLFKG